jgi:hypothetical protein
MNDFALAVRERNLHKAKELYEAMPYMDVSFWNEYPIRMAFKNIDYKMVTWLLTIKPSIDLSAHRNYALQYCCDIFRLCRHNKCNSFRKYGKNSTVYKLIDLYLELCPSILPNIIQKIGSNVMASGNLKILKLLMLKSQYRITNDHFDIACEFGHYDLVQYVASIYPAQIGHDDHYAFYWSCSLNHVKVAVWLQSQLPTIYHLRLNKKKNRIVAWHIMKDAYNTIKETNIFIKANNMVGVHLMDEITNHFETCDISYLMDVIYSAIRYSRHKIVEFLLSIIPNMSIIIEQILACAISNCQLKIATWICMNCANVQLRPQFIIDSIYFRYATTSQKTLKIVKYMLRLFPATSYNYFPILTKIYKLFHKSTVNYMITTIGNDIIHHEEDLIDLLIEMTNCTTMMYNDNQLYMLKLIYNIYPEMNLQPHISVMLHNVFMIGAFKTAKWLCKRLSKPIMEKILKESPLNFLTSICYSGNISLMKWVCSTYNICMNQVCQNPVLLETACVNYKLELAQFIYSQSIPVKILDSIFDITCSNCIYLSSIKSLIFQTAMDIVRWIISLYPDRYSIHISHKKRLRSWSINKNIQFEYTILTEASILENNPCAICYTENSNVQVLDCNHNYCSGCINKWYSSKETCPLCRETMTRFAQLVCAT